MDTPETTQLNQIDANTLNDLINSSGGSLIPESLVTTLTVGFIVLNVVGILLTVLYLISVIRKWKVQSAILHMQKDVAEIKQHLVTPIQAPAPEPVKITTSEPESLSTDKSTDSDT